MKRKLVITLSLWTVILSALAFTLVAEAAPACPSSALVQVQPGFTLNVRAQPGGVSRILGSMTERDGELHIVEERTGFLRLQTGGWIVNKYLSISCWGFGTPVATTKVPAPITIISSSTPQKMHTSMPTATARPVVIVTQTPQPTPTRLAVQLVYCASKPEIVEIEPGLWRVMCRYR